MTDDTPGTESNAVETPTGATTATSNFIARLFRGEVSLPVTYWIYGALVSTGFRIALEAIEANYVDLVSIEGGSLGILAFYWFVMGYTLFIFVAIWRSAGKYKGNQSWAALARLGVILGAISVASAFVSGLKQGSNSGLALREELSLINNSLPTMLDDDTRFDRVSLQGQDIHSELTMVKWSVAEIDLERLVAVMTARLKTDNCESDEMRPFLDEGRDLVFMYRDKQSDPVAKIVVTSADCL